MDEAGTLLPRRRDRRGRHPRRQTSPPATRTTRRPTRGVHRRLVPHRRPGRTSTPTATSTSPAVSRRSINRGGEKISPREVDEVLLRAPGGRAGGRLRRAAPTPRRGGRGGGRAARRRAAPTRPSCASSRSSGSPTSRCRGDRDRRRDPERADRQGAAHRPAREARRADGEGVRRRARLRRTVVEASFGTSSGAARSASTTTSSRSAATRCRPPR